jgi:hypothetical protein
MVTAGRAAGRLRSDIEFGDIGTLLVRLSRPLPGSFQRDIDLSLAHRHVDLFLAGLRTAPDSSPTDLAGPALTLGDLRNLGRGNQ